MWHGSVREELRGKTLGIGKQESFTVFKVSTPCLDDHQVKEDELEIVGELSTVCSSNRRTRHFKSDLVGKSDHEMQQSL